LSSQADARQWAKEALEAAENKEEKDISANIKVVPSSRAHVLAEAGWSAGVRGSGWGGSPAPSRGS
jgi:hypothetical protein